MLAQILRGREFWSAERTGSWQAKSKQYFDDPLHKQINLPLGADYITDPAMQPCWEGLWDLVFVDHFPDEARAPMISFLRDLGRALIVVVHDTSPDMRHRMIGVEEELQKWKYRYDYTKLSPWTSVVSNLVDVRNLHFGKLRP